ncbi:MAG: hypothetical protein ACXVLQ_11830 [Bacteriovorax sp.]
MLLVTYLSLAVFIAAFVGSLNGLGISFLLSLALLIFSPHANTSTQWVPYLSSLIVALIFVISRPLLVFKNLYPIVLLSIFCGMGLLVGKITTSHHAFLLLKIFFGLSLIVFSFFLKKSNLLKESVNAVYESEISFDFLDFLMFVAMGFFAGFFDFGIAAFIYVQMFLKNKLYNIEKIDVCVYGVLISTSIINLLFTVTRFEQVIPQYFGVNFILCILFGAVIARFIYRIISLNIRRQIVLFGIFLVGIKILVINLNTISINTLIIDFNSMISSFIRSL